MDRGWGFEEEDDEPDSGPVEEELLTGADADGIMTVTVDDAADVRAVRLGDGWQGNEVRRGLGARVVEAMTAATARAMANRPSGSASRFPLRRFRQNRARSPRSTSCGSCTRSRRI